MHGYKDALDLFNNFPRVGPDNAFEDEGSDSGEANFDEIPYGDVCNLEQESGFSTCDSSDNDDNYTAHGEYWNGWRVVRSNKNSKRGERFEDIAKGLLLPEGLVRKRTKVNHSMDNISYSTPSASRSSSSSRTTTKPTKIVSVKEEPVQPKPAHPKPLKATKRVIPPVKVEKEKEIIKKRVKKTITVPVIATIPEHHFTNLQGNVNVKLVIMSPTGQIHHVANLRQFCYANALSYHAMGALARGTRDTAKSCPGWTVKRMPEGAKNDEKKGEDNNEVKTKQIKKQQQPTMAAATNNINDNNNNDNDNNNDNNDNDNNNNNWNEKTKKLKEIMSASSANVANKITLNQNNINNTTVTQQQYTTNMDNKMNNKSLPVKKVQNHTNISNDILNSLLVSQQPITTVQPPTSAPLSRYEDRMSEKKTKKPRSSSSRLSNAQDILWSGLLQYGRDGDIDTVLPVFSRQLGGRAIKTLPLPAFASDQPQTIMGFVSALEVFAYTKELLAREGNHKKGVAVVSFEKAYNHMHARAMTKQHVDLRYEELKKKLLSHVGRRGYSEEAAAVISHEKMHNILIYIMPATLKYGVAATFLKDMFGVQKLPLGLWGLLFFNIDSMAKVPDITTTSTSTVIATGANTNTSVPSASSVEANSVVNNNIPSDASVTTSSSISMSTTTTQ